MSIYKQYRRTGVSELRNIEPHETAESLIASGVSISEADIRGGSPIKGDMVARNSKNHNDMWLVAEQYIAENLEQIKRIKNENTYSIT
jgi:hypothetical protein